MLGFFQSIVQPYNSRVVVTLHDAAQSHVEIGAREPGVEHRGHVASEVAKHFVVNDKMMHGTVGVIIFCRGTGDGIVYFGAQLICLADHAFWLLAVDRFSYRLRDLIALQGLVSVAAFLKIPG